MILKKLTFVEKRGTITVKRSVYDYHKIYEIVHMDDCVNIFRTGFNKNMSTIEKADTVFNIGYDKFLCRKGNKWEVIDFNGKTLLELKSAPSFNKNSFYFIYDNCIYKSNDIYNPIKLNGFIEYVQEKLCVFHSGDIIGVLDDFGNNIIPYGITFQERVNSYFLETSENVLNEKVFRIYDLNCKFICEIIDIPDIDISYELESCSDKFIFIDGWGKKNGYVIDNGHLIEKDMNGIVFVDVFNDGQAIFKKNRNPGEEEFDKYGYPTKNNNYSYGILDKEGNVLIEDYDYIGEFSEGYYPFKKDNKVGYMNKDFKVVFEGLEMVYPFVNGYAKVVKDNKYGLINSSFSLLFEGFDKLSLPLNGIVKGKKNGKWTRESLKK